MLKQFFFSLFFLIPTCAFSQVVIEKSFEFKTDWMYVDDFGYFYVGKGYTVYKFNSEGSVLNQYVNERRDSLRIVEFRNPYNLVLRVPRHQEIIFLDHSLEKIDEYKISDIPGTSGEIEICGSHLSGYYIYDLFNRELIKLNNTFKEEYRRSVNFGEDVIEISDGGDFLLLFYKSGDIASYDILNDRLSRLDPLVSGRLHQNGELFNGFNRSNRRLEFYNPEFLLVSFIDLPKEINIQDAVYFNGKILFFDTDRIYISSVQTGQ